MKPSVLVIAHPDPHQISFGADFADNFTSVLDTDYPIVVFPYPSANNGGEMETFLNRLTKENPECEKIVVADHLTASDLLRLRQWQAWAHVVPTFNGPELEQAVEKALTRRQEAEEKQDDSPEKREKSLQRSQKRILSINQQVEALHNTLLAVHQAESVAEVESRTYSALHDVLDLNWVRIFLHATEDLESQLSRIQGQTLFKSTLMIGARHLGKIVFARKTNKAFTKSEEESLQQVAESVALALDRLAKLELAETLMLHWDSTFDAISEPLCLTTEQFGILRTNQAFLRTTGLPLNQVLGQNAFLTFCGDKENSELAPSPNAIIVQRKGRQYEVTSQRIPMNNSSESILLILFRDITEQKKIEKQIFESSKMAELGTIGSSIAHDINNPLGGMLNFLQLIKMDLKTDDPIRADILEMEKAGHRCKEIVENLLSFTRRQETPLAEPIDIAQVLDQALKIIELQSRSLGIEVEVLRPPAGQGKILGHFNLLSQALSHVLQNAYEAVADRMKQNPGYKGQVKVEFLALTKGFSLVISDNGIGISPEHQNKILNPLFTTKTTPQNPGLGLTLAYKILNDHGGELEIISQPNVGTTVKISFLNV